MIHYLMAFFFGVVLFAIGVYLYRKSMENKKEDNIVQEESAAIVISIGALIMAVTSYWMIVTNL